MARYHHKYPTLDEIKESIKDIKGLYTPNGKKYQEQSKKAKSNTTLVNYQMHVDDYEDIHSKYRFKKFILERAIRLISNDNSLIEEVRHYNRNTCRDPHMIVDYKIIMNVQDRNLSKDMYDISGYYKYGKFLGDIMLWYYRTKIQDT